MAIANRSVDVPPARPFSCCGGASEKHPGAVTALPIGSGVLEEEERTEQLVQAVASASTLFASYSATVVPNGTWRITAEESGWRDWPSNFFRS